MPLYLKEYYKDEPLFANSKVITSIYENEIEGKLNLKDKKGVKLKGDDFTKMLETLDSIVKKANNKR